jgi:hypothetical protein
MASTLTTVHVLDKTDYTKHYLVAIPLQTLPTLEPSSLRFCPRILGLTTNNLTYARMGHVMGWYDIYPLPSNIPEPYHDSSAYGRVAAWGYADIVESTVPEIAVGQTLYGFLPISTGVETMHVGFSRHREREIPNQIIALDHHRQHLWKIYNRYTIGTSLAQFEKSKGLDSLGWDALMQGLFGTGYNLSTHGFAWTPKDLIHPSGGGTWTAEDADLRHAAVVILNASGKTGMAFAYALRRCRPRAHQPYSIVGVGSEASKNTIQGSRLFDEVVLNTDLETTKTMIEASGCQRVVLLDFGARVSVLPTWAATLSSSSIPFTLITIGGEVKPQSAGTRSASIRPPNQVNASLLREKGIEHTGEEYFRAFNKAWEEFKDSVQGVGLEWGEGIEAWSKGWDDLCKDNVQASKGLVYRI